MTQFHAFYISNTQENLVVLSRSHLSRMITSPANTDSMILRFACCLLELYFRMSKSYSIYRKSCPHIYTSPISLSGALQCNARDNTFAFAYCIAYQQCIAITQSCVYLLITIIKTLYLQGFPRFEPASHQLGQEEQPRFAESQEPREGKRHQEP